MNAENLTQNYGSLWTREELILAFDLYCRIPFQKTKANNPEVISLARLIGRTSASVARKLGNFGSFDPELKKQKISGLEHASKLDKDIWDDFHKDWNRLVLEARQLKEEFGFDVDEKEEKDIDIALPKGASEKEVIQKTRVHQSFFREAILSSYENMCCITGLKITECLVASHIIPWSVSEQHRTDPRNGLCLSATFDRLFDRGLITITNKLDVILSSRIRNTGDKRIEEIICQYHEKPMIRPLRFFPTVSHLEWHHKNVFQE